ncbi:MAG: lysozyme inhibitor LprI family protein [Novosphingobium sp.]
MRLLAALLAILLLGAAEPTATGPSFSCAGRLSASETAICDDPELSAWDRAIAVQYPRQLKDKAITRAKQRTWLDQRNACAADRACIRRAFGDWPGYPGSGRPGTSFSRPAKYDTGSLTIEPVGGSWYAFSIQAIHIVFDGRGKMLTANDGNADGVVLVRNGRGHFSSDPGDEFSCEVDFTRRRTGWAIADNGQCGGLNVVLDGDYAPDLKPTRN